MLWIVSSDDLKETANNLAAWKWFAFLSDAEEAAKRLANETGEPHHVYSFVRHHTIEPETMRTPE
jgi:hypothetical protein